MALKFELEQWQAACTSFDNGDFETSIKTFISIADSAKMHFNIGLIFATVEDHDRALAAYTKAITMDPYFAVAFFQRGVSYFIKNNMEAAKNDFDQALQKLRGNQIINYSQLGLSFRLYNCEVLFNRGICQLYLGKMDAGLTDLYHAQKSKCSDEHDVIDQAVKDRGKGYSVFSIPPHVIFRPPENRLKQLQGVDMFAAVDQLPNPKFNQQNIKRNNSVLLNDKYRKNNFKANNLPPMPIHTRSMGTSPRQTSPLSSNSPQQLTQSNIASNTPRMRKDSNFGMYQSDDSASTLSYSSSNYKYRHDGRRVDSGFESTLEDRYSSSSSLGGINSGRNSAKSNKQPFSPPPVPPIPKQHDEDPTTMYGDFDQELDEVYGSLHTLSVQDREKDYIRQRLNNGSGKDEVRLYPSTSNSSLSSNHSGSAKIKIKAHYTDTRILLVSTTISFDELRARIIEKFNAPRSIRLQYKDEDNEMVLMIDDDDLFMARQVNKSPNEFEKMEIWCV